MTTDTAPARVAASRFERLLHIFIATFAVLYALQTAGSLTAILPSVPGPLGALFIGLIAVSVVVGCAAGLLPRGSMLLFRTAFALYAFGIAVWPFALAAPLPSSPLVWPIAIWPVQAVFIAAGHRRVVTTIAIAVATGTSIGLVLTGFGGFANADAVVQCLYVTASTVVIAVLLGAVRQAIDLADHAQELAVTQFVDTKRDDAEELERIRTDALVHDCVLTTLLSAGSAVETEEEDLARRMAANALRVLGHVNRSSEQGPAVPFGRALASIDPEFAPILARFELRTAGTDDLMLPAHVTDALLSAMVTVMRESVAHGAPRSVRARTLGPDGIRIVVRDGGAEADAVVRNEIARRMRSIDGRAEIGITPGGGTAVTLSWGSVVITGTAPLADAELLVVA